MTHIWSIARKELRGYFNSAVALIFLGIFLGVTVFSLFWVEKFFARGLADVRPMFEWFPILLILLVSALTMRLWSEEQKTGTIELLLTLPVPPYQLVAGKFLAGLLLICLALGLTLPIPITVSMMGDLDWGPVIGGYWGAILLASAYLSIGLCISSLTDNQIVSLFGTGLLCIVLYGIGADALTEGRSVATGDLLRSLGTGSRFESVARGILDIRDLAYYLGLAALFFTVNVVLLEAKRWGTGRRSGKQRTAAWSMVSLVLLNVVALNVWLAPVSRARIDVTEDGLYSLSPVSVELLRSLDERLLIRGYFSTNTHPKIDPLVPEIRDLLEEYAERGGDNVVVEFVNPDDDEKLESEAKDQYNIVPDKFPITTRKKRAMVDAYFRILVEYGDQYEVLGFDQILNILQVDIDDVQVELGNLEYEITKTVKKVVYAFQDLDAVFGALGVPVKLTAYASNELSGDLKSGLGVIEKVAAEFVEASGGRMTFEKADPNTRELQEQLYQSYGIEPFRTLVATDGGMQLAGFYFHLVLTVGEQAVIINPPQDMTETTVRDSLEQGLKQALPGFIKTVGLVMPPAPAMDPQMQMQMRQMGRRPPPPPQSFELMSRELEATHRVRPVSLKSGRVDDGTDILILAGPDALNEAEQKAIDQFLMAGGAVIAFVGRHRLQTSSPNLQTEAVTTGLESMLATYGVQVSDKLVFDEKSDMFAAVDLARQRAEPVEVPFVLKVDRQGLGQHLTTTSLPGLIMQYASPVTFEPPKPGAQDDGADAPAFISEILTSSSEASWLVDAEALTLRKYDRPESVEGKDSGPHTLGIAVTGSFPSHFAARGDDSGEGGADTKPSERLLSRSPPGTRLIVIGSSSMIADTPTQLARQLTAAGGSPLYASNIPFLLNLIDWSVEDTDLLKIRARSAESRLLEIDESDHTRWEYINYGLALALILGVFGVTLLRRRSLTPIDLPPRSSRDSEDVA